MEVMKGIVRVVEGSSLVSKSIGTVETEFKIKITSKFNPYPAESNCKKVNVEDIIYPDLCLEYSGNYDSVKKFGLASVGLDK